MTPHLSPASVPSPCIKVCQVDRSRGLCVGCWRTLEEIGRWSKADTAEKLSILAQTEKRRPVMPG